MSGRHRHAVNVRTDGLAAVLGSLAHDARIRVAALVDVDSGMVLDSCGPDAGPETAADVEIRGAAHAELVRNALVVAPDPDGCEVVVRAADGSHHVLQPVPDPYGDRLALAVVVHGSGWLVSRLRRRLRAVSSAALTAGPSTALRPTSEGWRADRLREPVPVPPPPRPRVPPAPVVTAAVPVGTTPVGATPDGAAPDGTPSGEELEATGPRLPAMTRLAPPMSAVEPPSVGSAWTAPPAPSAPPAHPAAASATVVPIDPALRASRLPGRAATSGGGAAEPGRPAPPSALPPGARVTPPHTPA